MTLVDRLRAHCSSVGFDFDHATKLLLERIHNIGEKTFDDAVRMAGYAERIFDFYDETRPAERFTPLERRTIVLATLFSDIGKTGPLEADAAGQRLVADMFAVENVKDDQQSVTDFLRTYFPDDADERVARFRAMGLDPSMSLRQFWNLHSSWTLAIAEAAKIPLEAVAAAATHHLLDDVNPDAIVDSHDRFTRPFGGNAAFDRAEKLVIVLDKYDAARRRGHLPHAEAIAWLRDRIAKSRRFAADEELLGLVNDVEIALREA